MTDSACSRPDCPAAASRNAPPDATGDVRETATGDRQNAPGLSEVPRLLLTVEQAASALSLGRTAVYELIHSRRLGSVRIGGSRRIPRAALDAYVSQLCCDAGLVVTPGT